MGLQALAPYFIKSVKTIPFLEVAPFACKGNACHVATAGMSGVMQQMIHTTPKIISDLPYPKRHLRSSIMPATALNMPMAR